MKEEITQVRPLVTFALFAYNQEKYIREAIEGAFSQTYEPLEIILSDDCSTDRTFEIMREMVENYSGPHQVIVRRTQLNRGTFNHVLEAYHAMSGQLMILAAGDDVSYACRCSLIVDEWKRSGAKVIFSQYEKITDAGSSIGIEESSGGGEIVGWFPSTSKQQFNHGATTAYHFSIFDGLEYSSEPIFSEDAVFYFIAMVNKIKIKKLPTPLVKYRQSINSISNSFEVKQTRGEIERFEKKIEWMAKSYIALCDYTLCLIQGECESSMVRKRIIATRRFAGIRSQWINTYIWKRLSLVFECRESRELRFILPRIFGLSFFSIAKSKYLLMRKGG